ncbi:MAG: hypothetical protein CSA97_03835 [Bacteroidetes bacterium]|nr:MAG: hypothetical protein CSA97_03835 [Bacteroidota bacterium]
MTYKKLLTLGLMLTLFIGGGSLSLAKSPKTPAALGIRWVKIDGGEFLMGSPDNDLAAFSDEKPQHKVKLSTYWMSATEVTNAQYNQFLSAMKAKGGIVWKKVKNSGANYPGLPAKFKQPDQPVVCVSYEDAQAFCRWVGNKVSLPTEAQWEYACRAGSPESYGLGEGGEQMTKKNLPNYGWYGEPESTGATHPVATKKPNAFGLYDMYGNVWEWCLDYYSTDYYGQCKGKDDETVTDPTGPTSGRYYVSRGGRWHFDAVGCRGTDRGDRNERNIRNRTMGFRIVAQP